MQLLGREPCKLAPQAQGFVKAAGESAATVGTYGDGIHCGRMPLEGAQVLSGGEIPQALGLIIAAGESAATVGTYGDAPNRIRVPSECVKVFSGGEIP